MQTKTVWVILRSSVQGLPPVMSLLQALGDMPEYRVALISSSFSGIPEQANKFKEYILPPPKLSSAISIALQYAQFRFFTLRKLAAEAKPDDIIWLGSLDTALTLKSSKALKNIPYILQLHELYDTHPWRLRLIKKLAQSAQKVITPEFNRAAILQIWLGLKERPTVIPNKPYTHPRQRFLTSSTHKTRGILENFWSSEKKIVLYQGHISADRDLRPLAEAMRELQDMELWLMGHDHGYAESLTSISKNIKYLGHVPAPYHLEITSYATIGIMNYDPVSLNNLYCAPNKIWEYSGYEIPFISNDAPSIMIETKNQKIGVSIPFTTENIKNSINEISNNIDSYKANLRSYYESIDLKKLYKDVITSKKTAQTNPKK